MTIKSIIHLTAAVALGKFIWSAPLDTGIVSDDAKWLAHLDMQALKDSTIGLFALARVKEEIAKENDTLISIDIDLVAEELHSVTAYGTSFDKESDKNSVLIVRTGPRARSIIDSHIASMEWELEGKTGIKRLDDKAHDTYLIGNEVYASFLRDDLWVSSKSYDQIEKALRVIDGETRNLDASDSDLLIKEGSGFFFLATANGLDSLGDVPPQAKILQKAKGAQLGLGERGDMFRANLALSTPDAEVSSQLSRIVQGLVALASFAEIGNESLNTLMNNLDVEESDRYVSFDIEYPVVGLIKILKTLAEQQKERSEVAEEPAVGEEA